MTSIHDNAIREVIFGLLLFEPKQDHPASRLRCPSARPAPFGRRAADELVARDRDARRRAEHVGNAQLRWGQAICGGTLGTFRSGRRTRTGGWRALARAGVRSRHGGPATRLLRILSSLLLDGSCWRGLWRRPLRGGLVPSLHCGGGRLCRDLSCARRGKGSHCAVGVVRRRGRPRRSFALLWRRCLEWDGADHLSQVGYAQLGGDRVDVELMQVFQDVGKSQQLSGPSFTMCAPGARDLRSIPEHIVYLRPDVLPARR